MIADCINFKVPKSNCYMMRPAGRADRRSLVNIDNQPEELSANKLAAKTMKRKLKEADNSTKQQEVGSSIRYVVLNLSVHKQKDDNGDLHLAQKIMQNKQNTISGQADDEYDFEDCPSGKSWKKRK
ncbi:hypothetical protein Dsin_002973 [Dipteronia sinensis]|uniref:Uncharacterized protein n=1 Tax=Dipteronia sinensis TaxID=43782 RepID=A0AAE0B739_9ROSI|nr:hypothetical protein Dsin_002973 [Dipteronia sinensis]